MKCSICGKGVLKKKIVQEHMFGADLGAFPAEVCTSCNESFTDAATTQRIEEAAKQKGIWTQKHSSNQP